MDRFQNQKFDSLALSRKKNKKPKFTGLHKHFKQTLCELRASREKVLTAA
jgi:hypothetical protein